MPTVRFINNPPAFRDLEWEIVALVDKYDPGGSWNVTHFPGVGWRMTPQFVSHLLGFHPQGDNWGLFLTDIDDYFTYRLPAALQQAPGLGILTPKQPETCECGADLEWVARFRRDYNRCTQGHEYRWTEVVEAYRVGRCFHLRLIGWAREYRKM